VWKSDEYGMILVGRWMPHNDQFEEVFTGWPKFKALEIRADVEILPMF
jgi:hypothetical protein